MAPINTTKATRYPPIKAPKNPELKLEIESGNKRPHVLAHPVLVELSYNIPGAFAINPAVIPGNNPWGPTIE